LTANDRQSTAVIDERLFSSHLNLPSSTRQVVLQMQKWWDDRLSKVSKLGG